MKKTENGSHRPEHHIRVKLASVLVMKIKISITFRILTLSTPVRSHNCNNLRRDKIPIFPPNNKCNLIYFLAVIAVKRIAIISSINDFFLSLTTSHRRVGAPKRLKRDTLRPSALQKPRIPHPMFKQ